MRNITIFENLIKRLDARVEYVYNIQEVEIMTFGELKRLLKKNGSYFRHEGGRHEIWESSKTGKQFPVSRHDAKEVRSGTLNSIMKDAGLK
jgi:predicted RNA binding protein YcfA (HicA-like mRNA interferase family)